MNRYQSILDNTADYETASPDEKAPGMHVLIDTTHCRVLARHRSYLALAALHYIQFANVDAVIFSEGTSRPWSQFDANQLLDLLASFQGRDLGPHCYPYNEVILHVRTELERANWLICPFDAELLVKQANALAPDDSKPAKFNPDGELPIAVKKWTCEPQTKRPRRESSYATSFANQDASLPTSAPAAPSAPKPPRTRRSSAPRAPKAPGTPTKPPREPRVPRAPGAAPAAGSKTGKVWELADKALAACKGKLGDAKAFRAGVIAMCDKEGINKSTASVQFGKWKASKGL